MGYLVGDTYGLIHLIAAIAALISGTMILFLTKGTRTHVQVGYGYVVSMTILIITAFMIYRMFSGWGMFHYLTVVSLVSIALGMIPIWIKKPINSYKYLHFSFMYWSVIGLYAAFSAEVLTRVPQTPFFTMVGIATGGIMMIGGVVFGKNKKKWAALIEGAHHSS